MVLADKRSIPTIFFFSFGWVKVVVVGEGWPMQSEKACFLKEWGENNVDFQKKQGPEKGEKGVEKSHGKGSNPFEFQKELTKCPTWPKTVLKHVLVEKFQNFWPDRRKLFTMKKKV